jgi:hypothetical protein
MNRRPAIVTQADVARAIRAAQQCGAQAVEIKPDGTIHISLGKTASDHSGEQTIPEPKVIL